MVIMRTSPQSIPTPARRYSGWHFQLFRRLAVLPYKRSAVVTIAWMLVAGAVLSGRETKAQTILIPEGNPAISMEHFLGNAWSIAVDQDGHIYVADPINQVIRKYCPDGTPATVIGQVNRSGRVDGTAAEARFASPGSLCYDGAGGILVLDNSTYVRRINVATLTVSTLANLSGGVDGTHMYDVTLGTFQDSGTLNNLRLGQIAAQSPGVFYVSASDTSGVTQYLLRCAGPAAQAVATSRTPVASPAWAGTRGLAVDPEGNVFMPFPVLQGVATVEYIFRFPGGGVAGVTRHFLPIAKVNAMASGRSGRLYYFTSINPSFYAISSTAPDTSLATYTVLPTYPASPHQEAKHAAVTPLGDLLAVNLRTYDGAGDLCSPYGKVDCFSSADGAVGTPVGDTEPPTIHLTSPADAEILGGLVTLSATAADNSGAVQVQFRVNDRDFGDRLSSPPFSIVLNPANLPAGVLTLYAVAADAAGNPATTERVRVLNPAGLPNLDGEIFVADDQLDSPEGVAVDADGDVYVGDQTRILRFSPFGELLESLGTTNRAVVDGDAASARFANLRGLGADSNGRILAIDDLDGGGCYLRRFDPATGITTTLYRLDEQTNDMAVSDSYRLPDGAMIENGGPDWGWMDARDVAVAPNGDFLVTLGNLRGWDFFEPLYPYHFLARFGGNGNVLLAYSADGWLPDDNPRAVAVAPDGTILASFETDGISSLDSLFAFAPQFPVGGTNSVRRLLSGIKEVDYLASDGSGRVYVPYGSDGSNPARVEVVSGTQTNTTFFSLQQKLLNEPCDLAIDGDGNLYVICTELRFYDGAFRRQARVVRYAAAAARAAIERTWDGGGDGTTWSDPANWSGDVLPGPTNVVVIATNTIVRHTSGNTTVRRVECDAPLEIAGGSLTVTEGVSQINGPLTIASGATLTANGTNVILSASGPTVIDGANLYALGGAVIELPLVLNYAAPERDPMTFRLRASGAGSVLRFPNLTNVIGDGLRDSYVVIEALAGGRVELPAVAQMTQPYTGGYSSYPRGIQVLADGTNSMVDLSGLVNFADQAPVHGSWLEARNGGTILTGQLVALSGVEVRLNAMGTLNLPALRSVVDSVVTVAGLAANWSGVTNLNQSVLTLEAGGTMNLAQASQVDGATFLVQSGTTLELPQVMGYDAPELDSATFRLRASGAGSVLRLPHLTNVIGDGMHNSYVVIEALAGGRVELPAVAQMTQPYNGGYSSYPRGIQVLADGTNSMVDLSGLVSFADQAPVHGSWLEARNGGTILAGQLVALSGVEVA